MIDGHFVLGIDFGTSNSCVSIWRADKKQAKIIKNLHSPGSKITPSCITFSSVGFEEYLIGKPSTDKNTVKGLKNIVGLTYKDLPKLDEIQASLPTIHMRVNASENDPLEVECFDIEGSMRVFSVEHLVSLILSYLRTCAQTYLRKKPMRTSSKANTDENIIYSSDPLTRVVLGIPANFPEKSRNSLRIAAEMAGFFDISFMIESTAAAMAYGLLVSGEKRVLVFDMGGGTTDISILRIFNNNNDGNATMNDHNDGMMHVVVEYTGGCVRLGGQQIDQLVFCYVKEQLLKRKPTLSLSNEDNKKLLDISKQCKELLTTEESYVFDLSWLLPSLSNYETSPIVVTRTQFEKELLRDTVCVSIRDTLRCALQQCPQNEEVQEIVVVGGSSRVPCVQDTLRCTWHEHTASLCRDTEKKTTMKELCHSVDCEQCVAEGLSIKGALLSQCIDSDDFVSRHADTLQKTNTQHKLKRWLMMDAVPHTIGILLSSTDTNNNTNNNNSSTNNSTSNEKYFEPIVNKGSLLPCVARYTAPLDTPHTKHSGRQRRFVTLDVYEEIEDVVSLLCRNIINDNDNDDKKEAFHVSYTYHLLRSVDVPIETRICDEHGTDAHDPHQLTVEFVVDTEGVLSYTVYRYVAKKTMSSEEHHRNNEHANLKRMLIFSVLLLFVMYIFLKYQSFSTEKQTIIPSHDVDHSDL